MKSLLLVCLGLVLATANNYPAQQCQGPCDHCHKGKCYECPKGYYAYNNICYQCSTGNAWCLHCSNDSKFCYRCNPEFFTSEVGTCNVCRNSKHVPNCKFCSPDGKYCAACENNYELVNGKCVHNLLAPYPNCEFGQYNAANHGCRDCEHAIGWCALCSYNGGVCFFCKPGFFLTSNGLCDVCHNGIKDCEHCTGDGKVCKKCLFGYALDPVANKCVTYAERYSGYYQQ